MYKRKKIIIPNEIIYVTETSRYPHIITQITAEMVHLYIFRLMYKIIHLRIRYSQNGTDFAILD